MRRVEIGISTCPNDTFAFHALLSGELEVPGVELAFTLADVEELNLAVLRGRFDVCKVSAPVAASVPGAVVPLPVGWALGYGVGPVVLGAPGARERLAEPSGAGGLARGALAPDVRVLAPGAWTTAHLLWRRFHPEPVRLEHRVFSEIVPALEADRADLGVCIHEGRFTWREHDLWLAEDLGETWEREVGGPLPLGGLVARRTLEPDLLRRLEEAIGASLDWAWAHPEACLASMRRYAQEDRDAVLFGHVDLYVTPWTRDLGAEGRRALERLTGLQPR